MSFLKLPMSVGPLKRPRAAAVSFDGKCLIGLLKA